MRMRAPAKINLSLEVLGVRPDGYHELRTVFQALDLHDTLEFETAEAGLEIACDAAGIPLDERNLAWRAARLVWEAAGRPGEPAGRVTITKRIPAQGGLGGGSADGAAALVGWDRLWGTNLPRPQLAELAVRLGADVPFFLVGGTALGRNRGDRIEPLDDIPPRWVVLVFPPFGVSTPQAFGWWDEDQACGPRPEACGQHPSTAAQGGQAPVPGARDGCRNDLEAPVARRHPEIAAIRALLEQAGAGQAAMTGSGSTVFGLFTVEDGARSAAGALQAAGWRTLVTRTATRGESRL